MSNYICKICGKKISNLNRMSIHAKVHGMDYLDYLSQYEGFEIPKCPICGDPRKLLCGKEFRKTCGRDSCKKTFRERESLAKFGVKNPSQSNVVQSRRKETCIKKYGTDCALKSDVVKRKIAQTFLKKYGCTRPLQKQEFKDKFRRTCAKRFGYEFASQSPAFKKRVRTTCVQKYGVPYILQTEELRSALKQKSLEKYGCEHPSQSEVIKEKKRQTCLRNYGTKYPSQSKVIRNKIIETCVKKYGVRCPSANESVKKKAIETTRKKYGVDYTAQHPLVHSRIFAKRKTLLGGFLSNSERAFAKYLDLKKVSFKSEYFCNGHHFDFALLENERVKCLVEIDGEFYHGLLSDCDAHHVGGNNDHKRFQKVPAGVNYIAIDSLNVKEQFIDEILRIAQLPYENFLKEMLNSLPQEFPYPEYTEKRMRADWKRLCEYQWTKGQCLGRSIAHKFHRSIWNCPTETKPSPVEIWGNKPLLERCVREKYIYTSPFSSQEIAHGFFDCPYSAPIYSANPSAAKHFFDENTPDKPIIFDPDFKFADIMLGACASGKHYIGIGNDATAVGEAQAIIRFLGLDAEVYAKGDCHTPKFGKDAYVLPFNAQKIARDLKRKKML